jgi:hypothetical protein
MKRLKGTRKNHAVALDREVGLPTKENRPSGQARRKRLQEAIQRILDHPIIRHVGIDEIMNT